MEIYVQHACTQPISLYGSERVAKKLWIGANWLFLRRGIGASNQFEAGGFIRSAAGVEHPDLQYHFLPIAINYDGSNPYPGHGFQAHVGPMRPTSAGRMQLRSADPREPPSILFNYMATEGDRQEMRAAVRLTREVFAQKAFDPYRGAELAPGPGRPERRRDRRLRARPRRERLPPLLQLQDGRGERSHGGGRRRMPGLWASRPCAWSTPRSCRASRPATSTRPTIMLAEKAADLIRGRPPLPPLEAPVWIAPDWETRQR